jgi:hypothetical protein
MHADIARVYADDAQLTSSDESLAGAEHAWRAGNELDPRIALRLMDRAIADACARSAYREVAELDRRALDVCSRLPVNAERREREASLWLQLASVEAVVDGETSAKALDALRQAFEIGSGDENFASSVGLRCLSHCRSAQYREVATLSDGLIDFYSRTGDSIAGTAGYYFRGLVDFVHGRFGACLESAGTLLSEASVVDWQGHEDLLAFDVRGYGLAGWAHAMRGDTERACASLSAGVDTATARGDVFAAAMARNYELHLDAMTGSITGTEERGDPVCAEVERLGMGHMVPSARIVTAWARALGPNGVDTSDEVRDALAARARGGTRSFTALYLALLSDVEAAHRSSAAARTTLHKAELMAASTGERVWDGQLSARRLKLRADSYRSSGVDGSAMA